MKTPKTTDRTQSGRVIVNWQDNVLPCNSGRLKANLEQPTAHVSQVTQKEMTSNKQTPFCSKEEALIAIRAELPCKKDIIQSQRVNNEFLKNSHYQITQPSDTVQINKQEVKK